MIDYLKLLNDKYNYITNLKKEKKKINLEIPKISILIKKIYNLK